MSYELKNVHDRLMQSVAEDKSLRICRGKLMAKYRAASPGEWKGMYQATPDQMVAGAAMELGGDQK